MTEKLHQVYLGLGANLGDREHNIREAIRLIGERVGRVERESALIETDPWGFESDHRFLNAVILCLTEKSPREVLELTQRIEREMGRRRKTVRDRQAAVTYLDRPIDIDILLYDDQTVNEPGLIIPHPRMNEREFVMIPLQEIRN